MNPYFKKGYNVTMNNYFTSLLLADNFFLLKNTTIVSTVRKYRPEIPNRNIALKKGNYMQVKYIHRNLDVASNL